MHLVNYYMDFIEKKIRELEEMIEETADETLKEKFKNLLNFLKERKDTYHEIKEYVRGL